ncbi:hypothetical protein CK203_028844 [Vitis vinifera]|uniref:Uncharacterized protein n=1 Tax=Vitis vinifera TaxID=29760 RepID=A0A438IAB6_VITVI|nr:hypothetical protein CK203_028844 [Vitis vinifera]
MRLSFPHISLSRSHSLSRRLGPPFIEWSPATPYQTRNCIHVKATCCCIRDIAPLCIALCPWLTKSSPSARHCSLVSPCYCHVTHETKVPPHEALVFLHEALVLHEFFRDITFGSVGGSIERIAPSDGGVDGPNGKTVERASYGISLFVSQIDQYGPRTQPFGILNNTTTMSFMHNILRVSMDTVMQAIFPNTPFSHSISLNPLGFIDELFQRANKYSMLEDDLRVATKQGGLNLG